MPGPVKKRRPRAEREQGILRGRNKPIPEQLRHRIEAAPSGGWHLVTHYGHEIFAGPSCAAVELYYSTHCCTDGWID